MQERQLIDRAKAGDRDAFVDLLSRYDRQIMSVVYRFTGNHFDREDLYQEVFLHVFQALRDFRGDASFTTWLYRIALNRCTRQLAARRRFEVLEDQQDAGANHERQARLQAVHGAISRLRGPQRICFHLHYIEDWRVERIAETLAIGTGTVKSHLDRARKKIKLDKEVLAWLMS